MITLKDFFEATNYRITEGSIYGWNCYGHNAYQLDSWDGNQDGHSLSIIFDTQTQVVYQAEVHDYANHRSYRLINPDFLNDYKREAKVKCADDMAYDGVAFIELDVDADFLEKASAVVEGRDYDTRVSIAVDFTDEELFSYMKMAHSLDITFNEFVETAIKAVIKQHNSV